MRTLLSILVLLQSSSIPAQEPDPHAAVQVADLRKQPLPATVGIDNLVEFEGHVYFTVRDGANGPVTWRTDGTPEGTEFFVGTELDLVTPFRDGFAFSSRRELWVSDGSAGGSRLVSVVPSALFSRDISRLVAVRDHVYFEASAGMYQSDGTAGGTSLFDCDIDGLLFRPQALDESLVFFSTSGGLVSLWSTDGSCAGTVELRDRLFGVLEQVRLGDSSFFVATSPGRGLSPGCRMAPPPGPFRWRSIPVFEGRILRS